VEQTAEVIDLSVKLTSPGENSFQPLPEFWAMALNFGMNQLMDQNQIP